MLKCFVIHLKSYRSSEIYFERSIHWLNMKRKPFEKNDFKYTTVIFTGWPEYLPATKWTQMKPNKRVKVTPERTK